MEATNNVYQLAAKLISHKRRVRCLTFSPNNQFLASGSEDQVVSLWAIPNGSLVQKLIGHKDYVLSLAFSPDGQLLASASSDGTIRLWRAPYWEFAQTLKCEWKGVTVEGFAHSVAFFPSGELLAGGMSDGWIGIWRISDGNMANFIAAYKGPVWAVAISPDGRFLVP